MSLTKRGMTPGRYEAEMFDGFLQIYASIVLVVAEDGMMECVKDGGREIDGPSSIHVEKQLRWRSALSHHAIMQRSK